MNTSALLPPRVFPITLACVSYRDMHATHEGEECDSLHMFKREKVLDKAEKNIFPNCEKRTSHPPCPRGPTS
ncbi:hypothetical protein POVWA2_027070 [Plasmodium ovale wallikeri]|uniref:Uncharacterized protein n=1 Tax=Plasmodium ovale wallikeri TaxID=864142 RepID=A0A1A8YWB9_PLAOA|nr:hypothetical protein POVWA1_029060 [Plasmodium ovale wallikeri]SBT35843.1 hypothetical protein POVWA2_027070 [Plasmodium ovale wallikeri]